MIFCISIAYFSLLPYSQWAALFRAPLCCDDAAKPCQNAWFVRLLNSGPGCAGATPQVRAHLSSTLTGPKHVVTTSTVEVVGASSASSGADQRRIIYYVCIFCFCMYAYVR